MKNNYIESDTLATCELGNHATITNCEVGNQANNGCSLCPFPASQSCYQGIATQELCGNGSNPS